MRCKTIARLHRPHRCRRLYNARNCITASRCGHNGKFAMIMSTTCIIPRTRTKSGHEIRSATPKMHPQAPHRNGEKAWFTQASPRAKQEDVDIETLTQPQAPYVTNLGRKHERERGSQGRKPTCKTLSQIRCEVGDEAKGRSGGDTARLRACALRHVRMCARASVRGRAHQRQQASKRRTGARIAAHMAGAQQAPTNLFSLCSIALLAARTSPPL